MGVVKERKEMLKQSIVVKNASGLHLRPAGNLCKEALKYESKISIIFGNTVANAKSATEAYARAQADLLKLQAITEANRTAGLAITAEQQARIQEAQRNLQIAKTHAEQKVNELNIGGKNLLRNSKQRITNSNYNIATYHLTEELRDGDVVTLTIKGHLGAGKLVFAAYNSGGFLELSQLFDKGNGIYQNTFNWRKVINGRTADNKTLWIWTYDSSVSAESTIEWIKLERGNKPTDWSPAPEDIENQIANINSDLEIIRRNAKRIEDLENQNKAKTDERIGKLDQKTAFLNDTQIAGNVVATGTMIVGNTTGTQAGITGVGNATNEVRLFAGSEFAGRYAAPFRVLQDGTLYATNAHISGVVNATSGSFTGTINAASGNIGGFTINSDYIGKKYGFYDTHDDQGCYIDIGGMCVWKRQYSQEYKIKVLEIAVFTYFHIGFWIYPAGKNTPIKHRLLYRDSSKDKEYKFPSY